MAESLQYKLYNASIAPPGDAWQKIAEELDKDAAHRISLKMQEATLTPPAAAWQNILEVLNEASPSQAKVIQMSPRWAKIAAAAIVAGIIVLAGLYYFMSADSNSGNTASKQTTSSPNNSASDSNNSTNKTSVTENTSSNPKPSDGAIADLPTARPVAIASMGFSPRIRHSRVQNIPATGQVNVDEAIGDGASLQPKANIPPQQYLTVAAPNGQPAKISTRFTDAVICVLIDVPPDNMNGVLKSISWKQRVNNWRKRLMVNGAFIPAGTNFLDIVELEELLKE
jgi:hypothetical protein